MLSQEQLQEIKEANAKVLIRGLSVGKSLSGTQMAAVESVAEGKVRGADSVKLYTVSALAQLTGHERRKITSILDAAKVIAAKAKGDTKYYILEDVMRALNTARHKITSERTALECEKLRVQIDRIQFQSRRERGQFWNSDDVRRKMIGNIQSAKRALLDLPDELAPAVAGLPVAEIHRRLTEGIDAAILLLQSGWVDGEAQHQPNDQPEIEQEAESEPE